MARNYFLFFLLVITTSVDAQIETVSFDSAFSNSNSESTFLMGEYIVKGSDRIQSFVNDKINSGEKELDIETLESVEVNAHLKYEIRKYRLQNSSYISLIVWSNIESNWTKELEYIFESKNSNLKEEEINESRQLWVKKCNSHEPSELINELYLKSSKYYNRGRLIQEHGELIREYSYMANPKYNLNLKPISVVPINEDTAIELGKCEGSYNLPYALVWKKELNQKWKLLFDTNY